MPNPWQPGPPDTLRHVAENTAGTPGVYAVTAAEHPDGTGRSITVEVSLATPTDEERRIGPDTYSIWLEPPFESQWGGTTECVLTDDSLHLRLTPDTLLTHGPLLHFRLTLDAAQLTLLREGLRRTLTAGRPDQHPARLDLAGP